MQNINQQLLMNKLLEWNFWNGIFGMDTKIVVFLLFPFVIKLSSAVQKRLLPQLVVMYIYMY